MALTPTSKETTHTDKKLSSQQKNRKTKVISTVHTEKRNRLKETKRTKRYSANRKIVTNERRNNLTTKTMATYYSQYQIPRSFNIPVMVTEWSQLVSTVAVPNPYTSPIHNIPVTIISPQMITPLCPYKCAIISPDSIVTPAVPNIVVNDVMPVGCNLYSPKNEPILNNAQETTVATIDIKTELYNYNGDEDVVATQIAEAALDESKKETKDLVEYYLALPKELFPTARMLAMDPNFIIDEFCKISDINENVSWILDLEFGIPRVPVTRAIAVYDVKYNSVHCKNTPSAIHPGFEKCNEDFKRVVLFYYDCIVSTWYKGYIILNYDKSVENFQSWLLLPMQMFGMCWP